MHTFHRQTTLDLHSRLVDFLSVQQQLRIELTAGNLRRCQMGDLGPILHMLLIQRAS